MLSSTAHPWDAWLRLILDPATSLSVHLVGLPGRMRLPSDWLSRGNLPHEHLIYLVAEGAFQGETAGESLRVQTGELLWILPGTDFIFRRMDQKPLSIWRCRLRIGATASLPWNWKKFASGNKTSIWFESLIQEADQTAPWSNVFLRSLLGGLFTVMARSESAHEPPEGTFTAAQRLTIVQFLADRPNARSTPRELARTVGLSADYFSRCFRRTYGCTPRRWLLEQRIRLAALRLSESDRRVGEIATAFGYDDVFLFSRQFKAVTGKSPLEYRKSNP